jgi:DNA-binding CsgD family transcriptional regulator
VSNLCPSCGQVLPKAKGDPLTPAELDALSAWWHMGTVKRAADLLSRSERTVVNQLYTARNRNGVHTTVQLAQLQFGKMRSLPELMAQHNSARKAAA